MLEPFEGVNFMHVLSPDVYDYTHHFLLLLV